MIYRPRTLEQWAHRADMNEAMGVYGLTEEEVKILRVEWALDPPDDGDYMDPYESWMEEKQAAMVGEP
jgi:hypothetical protein